MEALSSGIPSAQEPKKVRNSSLEVLRLISMFLIVVHHYSVHGGFDLISRNLSTNYISVHILAIGGKLSVNLFILISGYFMIDSQFKIEKLLKLVCQVLFYSVGIYALFCLFGGTEFSVKMLIKSFFPISRKEYWFATTYTMLYVLSPFINKFIRCLDRQAIMRFICVCAFIWCIIPTFIPFQNIEKSDLIWFILLYSVAAYIKLFPSNYTSKLKLNIGLSSILLSSLIISILAINFAGSRLELFKGHALFFTKMDKLPTFLLSITLFLVFKNMHVKASRPINALAMTTFGIYLIHDNDLVRKFIWIDLFNNASHFDSPFLIAYALGTSALVFIACSAIDYLRIKLLEQPLTSLMEKKRDRITAAFDALKSPLAKIAEGFINMLNA